MTEQPRLRHCCVERFPAVNDGLWVKKSEAGEDPHGRPCFGTGTCRLLLRLPSTLKS